jgi:hypothetical protein
VKQSRFFTTLGRAAGPVAASLSYAAHGSYRFAFTSLAAAMVTSAVLVVIPWRLPGLVSDVAAPSAARYTQDRRAE